MGVGLTTGTINSEVIFPDRVRFDGCNPYK